LATTTNISVFEVAKIPGYQSDAAFAKAFKKHFGFRPGAVRKKSQAA